METNNWFRWCVIKSLIWNFNMNRINGFQSKNRNFNKWIKINICWWNEKNINMGCIQEWVRSKGHSDISLLFLLIVFSWTWKLENSLIVLFKRDWTIYTFALVTWTIRTKKKIDHFLRKKVSNYIRDFKKISNCR